MPVKAWESIFFEGSFENITNGRPLVVANYFSMYKKDVAEVMKCPWQKICTDNIVGERSHPRNYSPFPKVLGFYCCKQKIISMEEVIRKMTSRNQADD